MKDTGKGRAYIPLPGGKAVRKQGEFTSIKYNSGSIIKANPSSLEKFLGPYYLDLTPSLIDYAEFRYGEFDENGVPMVGWGEKAEYFPVNIAQFGFIVHDLYLKNKDELYLNRLKAILNWFEKNKKEYKKTYIWTNDKRNYKYNLPAGYVSGMAIGEIISFYLRMYQLLKQEHLLDTALKTYDYLKIPFEEGGVRRYDENENLWFEEYPTQQPSFVLNGFIYTIFGLFDLYRATGNQDVKNDIDACILTLKNSLHKYDTWYWSLYDQLKKELVMVYYQKNVHAPQMDALFKLTGEEIFKKYRDKWEKNLNWANILFVKFMYRIKPRVDKLKQLF